jgi:hypothetical protein
MGIRSVTILGLLLAGIFLYPGILIDIFDQPVLPDLQTPTAPASRVFPNPKKADAEFVSILPIVSFWDDVSKEVVPVQFFGCSGGSLRKESDIFMTIKLERILGQTESNTIYAAGERFAIKYNAHCVGADGQDGAFSDPLALESDFLNAVNRNAPQVAIRQHYLSPTVAIPKSTKGFGKLAHAPPKCRSPAHVRFLVVERVSATLWNLLPGNKAFPVNVVAAMGIQLVRLLRQLHALNIAHGDIHLSNVAVSKRDPAELILIDFGLARRPRSDISRDHTLPIWCHEYISPWESLNWGRSYRDDMFRAIQLLAILLHGKEYGKALGRVCTEDSAPAKKRYFIHLKSKENLFHTTFNVGDPNMPVKYHIPPSSHRGRQISLFAQLLRVVRMPATPSEKPDYDIIEQILTQLVDAPEGRDPAELLFK